MPRSHKNSNNMDIGAFNGINEQFSKILDDLATSMMQKYLRIDDMSQSIEDVSRKLEANVRRTQSDSDMVPLGTACGASDDVPGIELILSRIEQLERVYLLLDFEIIEKAFARVCDETHQAYSHREDKTKRFNDCPDLEDAQRDNAICFRSASTPLIQLAGLSVGDIVNM